MAPQQEKVLRVGVIQGGKIVEERIIRQREFMNPFNQLRALNIEVPTINRGGIPT